MAKTKVKTIEELLKGSEKYISAIYKIKVNNPRGSEVVWKITSEDIPSLLHFDKQGKFKFQGKTLHQALESFFNDVAQK